MKEYIEREAAIHAITDTMENYSTFSTERCACIIERQKIKNLPAANVAPVRHGRWIHPRELFRMWSRSATQGISRGAEIL